MPRKPEYDEFDYMEDCVCDCPYQVDVNGDEEYECDCCLACQADCADEV